MISVNATGLASISAANIETSIRPILTSLWILQIVAHLDVFRTRRVAVFLVEILGGWPRAGAKVDGSDPGVAQTLFEVPQQSATHSCSLGLRPHAKDVQVENVPSIGWLPVADGERHHHPLLDGHQAHASRYF